MINRLLLHIKLQKKLHFTTLQYMQLYFGSAGSVHKNPATPPYCNAKNLATLSINHFYALLFCVFFNQTAFAATWLVGPGQTYTAPSQVAALVAHGDTVSIAPGLYASDVCTWTANRLVLRGNGPSGVYAHLRADNQSAGGKAIWVIKGDSVRVENIEFSLCTVPDNNGAGIRAEGLHLTVSHCSFHHNEMGILSNNDHNAVIIIEYSEFGWNGYGDGYSHNVYIGSIKSLVFRYNYSHHGKTGHLLKSRAQTNHILYNRLTDEPGTDASREIDLPNGGTAIILGNIIQQSAESQNGNIIGYGMEGLANAAPHALYMAHNTLVNERFAGRFVMFPAGLDTFVLKNNLLVGPGTVVDAPALPIATDTSHNLALSAIASAGFVDDAAFNYQLTASSPALNGATNAGWAGSFSLVPTAVYEHPQGWVPRIVSGNTDIGAYEFQIPSNTQQPAPHAAQLWAYPNPAQDMLWLNLPKGASNQNIQLELYDAKGTTIAIQSVWINDTQTTIPVSVTPITSNWAVIRVILANGRIYSTVVAKG